MNVDVLLHPSLSRRGPTYIAGCLAERMDAPELKCTIYTGYDRWSGRPLTSPVVSAIPNLPIFERVPNRIMTMIGTPMIHQRLKRRLLGSKEKPIVYTFGPVSLEMVRWLHSNHFTVVREKFNCAQATAKAILDEAYAEIGLPRSAHGLTEAAVARENEGLMLADAVFCPSPMVAKSLLDIGVPEERLFRTSYGWDPERFAVEGKGLAPCEGVTLVFVGHVCVRKGAHILLQAWKRAGIKGRLVIAGAVEPIIAEKFGDLLAAPDVVYMPYTNDIPGIYRSADWFVFPTYEEGGPLVTYEAAACGLPGLLSPMGAGAFTRDGVDGIVVPKSDVETWTDAIASLPDRVEARCRMADSACQRALDFTWEKVGARRREALANRFAH